MGSISQWSYNDLKFSDTKTFLNVYDAWKASGIPTKLLRKYVGTHQGFNYRGRIYFTNWFDTKIQTQCYCGMFLTWKDRSHSFTLAND